MVAEHLVEVGFPATPDDLVTSAQATGRVLRETLPAGSRVLVCGTANLVAHVVEAGMVPVASADDSPVAVVMGYHPRLTWPELDEASFAVQAGATWIATNPDLTRPTHRGIVPGLGAMLQAVTIATGRTPDMVVGKPYRPLMAEALRRSEARRPVFVGDRIDTDIMGAHTVGIDSFMVFTGAHGAADLLDAPPEGRPTAIGWSVASLLEPRRTASVTGSSATCGTVTVRSTQSGGAQIEGGGDRETQLDALWALAQLVWSGQVSEGRGALVSLDLLP